MADRDSRTTRARVLRGLAVVLLVVLVAAAVTTVFLPDLLPSSTVRREVATLLSERLGRPVTVASAELDWREGLTARGVRVSRRDGEGRLAEVDRLTVQFAPTAAARAAVGRDARFRSIRFDGLELWLVVDEAGRLNVADLLEAESLDVGVVQVGNARVHFHSRQTGGDLDFANVHASVGELSGTGNGYVSLSADLCRADGGVSDASVPAGGPSARCGRVVLTANIDRRRTGPDGMPVGSLKAEWAELPWDRLWAVAAPESPLAGLVRETSGRMSATLGEDAWSAEGAVEADRLAWPAAGAEAPTPMLSEAILGFRLHRSSASLPVVLDAVTLSAPGLNLKVGGSVAPSRPAAGEGTNDEAALSWARPALNLWADGTVSWGPLCRRAPPLGVLVETFDRLGGQAQVGLKVGMDGDRFRLTATADLGDTVMVAPGWFEKQEGDPLRLDLEGTCDRGFQGAATMDVAVQTAGATMRVRGTPPLDGLLEVLTGADEDGANLPARLARLSGDRATAEVEVRDVAAVLALVPALGDRLGPLSVGGPCRLDVAVQPVGGGGAGSTRGDGAAPEAWTAVLRADLTETDLALAARPGSRKPAGTLARVDADAVVWPGQRRSDLRRLAVRLGEGRIVWDGSARIDWPRKEGEQPVGRFTGTLALDEIAKAGALIAPERFEAASPAAGKAVFDVTADLADGRLRTHMEAGLEKMDLRLGRYLAKPAGRPATLRLTTLLHAGRWNRVQGEMALDLPGVSVSALGEAVLVAEWMTRSAAAEDDAARRGARPTAPSADDSTRAVAREDPRAGREEAPRAETQEGGGADEADPSPRPRSSVAVTLGPKSTVEIEAAVSDLKEAASLSPLLADALEGDRASGRAQGRLVLSLRRDGLQASGTLDLTATALNLGRLLSKPAGRVLRAQVAGDVAPHPRGWIDARLARSEVRLGESVTRLSGGVRLDWAALTTAAADPWERLAAAVRQTDVTAEGDWRHGPDLARMLPWLAPLRARCGLDGATRWTLALAGSPTRGRLDLDLDATACRVSAAPRGKGAEPVTVKTAGTPASIDLSVRYGEVPGEMVVEDVHLHLADATATGSGRLLFDDPRFLVPARPTAWTLAVDGRVPDAAILASLLPWRLADLEPTGAVDVHLRAAADAKGSEVESCRLRFDEARIRWLEREVRLDGAVAYDHESLQTDGLDLKAGGSDLRIVTYIARPSEDPTGSLLVRGKTLDVEEVLEMIRRTSASLGQGEAAAGDGEETTEGAAAGGQADGVGARLHRLLARAHLSADVRFDRVVVVNPKWGSRYHLAGLEAEGRLADKHLSLPRFACRLNDGTVTGRVRLDFRQTPPLLYVAYDARDLRVDESLRPFIASAFPDMQVHGTLTTRATRTQALAAGSVPVGEGETILTDGLLEGPSAPDYVTSILPGLKLTRYEFNRMSNVFENRPDGITENRMLFDGKAYDLFIFGRTYPDGRTRYTMGVDLLLSLGSEVSRTLDQGKLPLLHYNGRIVGKAFAERDISYVLPHELMYDVFLRRNVLLRLVRSLGRPEPEIKKPAVVPPEERRLEPGLAQPRQETPPP